MPCSYCRMPNHTVDRCHHGALLRSMHIYKFHVDPYNNFQHNRLWFVNNGMYPQHNLYDVPIGGYNNHGVKLVKKYLKYVVTIARYNHFRQLELSCTSNLILRIHVTNILNNQVLKKFIQLYYDGPNNIINMREIYAPSYDEGCNMVQHSITNYNFVNNVRCREIFTRDVQNYGMQIANQLQNIQTQRERYDFIRSLPLTSTREESSNTDVDEITTAAEILTTMNHDEVLESVINEGFPENNNDNVDINSSIQIIDNRQIKLDKLILVEKPYDNEECQICYDKIGCVNNIVLRCGHKYCSDCFLTHFQNPGGTNCPCCKQEIAIRVDNWLPPKDESQDNLSMRIVRTIPSPPLPRSNSVPSALNNWINSIEDDQQWVTDAELSVDIARHRSFRERLFTRSYPAGRYVTNPPLPRSFRDDSTI